MSVPEWLTVKQAAELLGVSTRTIHRLKKSGKIIWSSSYNKRVRILASSVTRLLI